MSLRLNMRRAARRARSRLPDARRTIAFLASQVNRDGGFQDRAGRSDLYYTVFGLQALAALDQPAPPNGPAFLGQFRDIDRLDFVHLNCLARCWGSYPADAPDAATRSRMLARIETFRTADGGYSQWAGGPSTPRGPAPDSPEAARSRSKGGPPGSAYGCILALGAYQDLGNAEFGMRNAECEMNQPSGAETRRLPMGPIPNSEFRIPNLQADCRPPDTEGLLACLATLKTADGGYVNEPGQSTGLTPATAAAVTVQAELGGPQSQKMAVGGPDQVVDAQAVRWLLARHIPAGGFAAMPALPLADLLSTATALHALARAGADVSPLNRACRQFVLSMWDDGAFRGNGFDDIRDCEYTFYGLLALGHLSGQGDSSG